MKSIFSLFTGIIVCVAAASANGALYTLSNGGFESPPSPGQINAGSEPAGFDWHVASGDIELIGTLWQPASGAQSIDLNGLSPGTIYQDFTFAAGGQWAVMFAMSANPDSPDIKALNVSFGPSGGSLTSLGNYVLSPGTRTYQNMQWITVTTPAVNVQDAVLYRLQFTSLNPASNYGPALDDIQLVQVPEPSFISLLSVGLLVFVRSYRKRGIA